MILGAKLWADRDTYFTQTNNPTECMLKKMGAKWLETCGPTAAANCLAALGYNLTVTTPGGWVPQPEEVLEDFLNDPRNYPDFRTVRPGLDPASIPGNRVPQYYPLAVARVFGAQGRYIEDHSFDALADHLSKGMAAQICLINPGHYLAAVAYDDETHEIIYRDPWPARLPDGNGFNRRLTAEDCGNVKNFYVLYTGG